MGDNGSWRIIQIYHTNRIKDITIQLENHTQKGSGELFSSLLLLRGIKCSLSLAICLWTKFIKDAYAVQSRRATLITSGFYLTWQCNGGDLTHQDVN